MLSSVFEQKEVIDLFSKVAHNPRYYDKKKKDSINYEKFSGLEQPFFLLFDSLFKYQVIIEDLEYLTDYVHHLDLLWYKIDNFHDISEGVSKILVKFCARKLGFKNKEEEHRKEILEYIYQKYIVDGYFYHAISDVFISNIQKDGFYPQKYENFYSEFEQIQKKFPSFFVDMDFHHDYVTFTDDFVMACYYATYSPHYFSNFLCPKSSKKVEINCYAKRDYMGCFRGLKHMLKSKDMTEEDIKTIEDLCNKEWKLLRQNESKPTIMLVKRSYFSKNMIHGIEEIIHNTKDDLGSLASHIMDYKFDSLPWRDFIPANEISFLVIPYSDFVVECDSVKVEVVLPTVRPEESDEDGKVSFLFLLGSLFILAGVVISILMLYQ